MSGHAANRAAQTLARCPYALLRWRATLWSMLASERTAMTAKPQLRLDTTRQFLSMPLVGPHDNHEPVKPALERSVEQLLRISGH